MLCALLAIALSGCLTRSSHATAPPSIWPLPASYREVTSEFGRRANGHFHKAIDIRAPKKTPVCATAPGVVISAERNGDYGKVVRIDHQNGYETWYAHLNRIKTKPGRYVKKGKVIGKVGKTGNATGYHLHYEVRKNGQPIDPRTVLPRQ